MSWVDVEFKGVGLQCYYDEINAEDDVGIPFYITVYRVEYKGVDVTRMVRTLVDINELAYESFERQVL